MRIILSHQSKIPLYQQIKEQIVSLILRGELQSGESLPSLRALANELSVSLLTIRRVYADLEAEGLLETRPGLGSFVARVDPSHLRKDSLDRFRLSLAELFEEGGALGLTQKDMEKVFLSFIEEQK